MRARRNILAIGLALGLTLGLAGLSDPAAAQSPIVLPEVSVTASRLGSGIVGASTTVITAEDIARSPGNSIVDVLAREPGIQTQSLFGGVNGAQSTVDLRGFGAFGAQNTLVLVNGRRINDLDLDQVNFSAIPKNSIERIEITRGNSGAVLYGDNVMGGVINIITKSPVGAPPSARFESAYGSFNQREVAGSASASKGPWSVSAYANTLASDGWRDNNQLHQTNGVGEARYTIDGFSAFLNVTADDQKLGFPGGRLVTPTSSALAIDPRAATTPFDYGNRQGSSVTTGFTRQVNNALEVIVDGGIRQKKQQAALIFDCAPFNCNSYVDTTLMLSSFTPRMISTAPVLGLPSRLIAGVDVQRADYHSDRPADPGLAPVHQYNLVQNSAAIYAQETLALRPDTDLSFGARLHHNDLSARDHFDPFAPGAFGLEGQPYDKKEYQYALHAGVEHRFNGMLTGFARAGRAFRYPNVDERIGTGRLGLGIPVNFDLKTQTSRDVEGGLRLQWDRFTAQSSVYLMDLKNELAFDPVNFVDYNLDPTRRYGSETTVGYRLSDSVRLKGGLAYTRAVFRDGVFAGQDVPLVARWTASGGVSWDIYRKWLTFDASVRYLGPRRMANDNANVQPLIPSRPFLDLRLGGEVDKFFWSVAFQNAFTNYYYDYAVASASTIGRYNAYPLPGRTFMARAGMTF